MRLFSWFVGACRIVRRRSHPIHAFSMWRGLLPGAIRITSTRMSSPGPA
jgi:hypothetical protein